MLPKPVLFVLHPVMLAAYGSAAAVLVAGWWKDSFPMSIFAAILLVLCFAMILGYDIKTGNNSLTGEKRPKQHW